MTDYSLQIGFNWEHHEEGESLSFVFLCDGAQYGNAYTAGSKSNSATYSYNFADGDTLTWEIFDLTGDDLQRKLCDVNVQYGNTRGSTTPFKVTGYQPPSSVACSGTKVCSKLPGGKADIPFPFWTPKDAKFTFSNQTDHPESDSFVMKIEVEQPASPASGSSRPGKPTRRWFSVDPEMIVGSGSGT